MITPPILPLLLASWMQSSDAKAPAPAAAPAEVIEMARTGEARVTAMQEGEGAWPYEGVYRVGGKIPEGYRIGGTAISGEMLLRVPAGTGGDETHRAALRKAVEFVCTGPAMPKLALEGYEGGYDVRGWGACYGARFLLLLKAAKGVPEGLESKVDEALAWYLHTLEGLEIPQVGGWNYARKPGADTPCAASPFMTGPCLQTLFEARRQGMTVDAAVVERGLSALERCRTESGNYAYSAQKQTNESDQGIPGAVGRMVCGEATLFLAGRSDSARVKRAVEAFIEHWGELEKRRAKSGTHAPPYGVAPYYFYFAHFFAAQAVELLPDAERPALRVKLQELLLRTRSPEGTWNDRVFPRSAAYGTSMAVMSMLMPWSPPPARWEVQTN